MGSIDKFGRPLWSKKGAEGGTGLRGPKGEGFLLDAQGHYLVSLKRIKELQDPVDDHDAVNKQWLESRLAPIDESMNKLKGFGFDADGILAVSLKRVRDLDDPAEDSDAVNKRWVESRIKPINDQLKIFEEDKQATLNLSNLFYQAMEQGEKAYDKATSVESTLRGLSSRLVALESRQ